MIEKIKFILQQTMTISFGILAGLSIEGLVYHVVDDNIVLQWYHPLSIILCGFICSLGTLFFWADRVLKRQEFRKRVVIHFLFLFVVVIGMGYLFHWFSKWDGALFIALEYVVIYVFVWVVTKWIGMGDQKKINEALEHIRDEE